MDLLKSQFDRIQQQLAGLTASQKMLTGALGVIMVMTLLGWSRFAGQAEMEPLLSQTLNEEDLSRIALQLDGSGIHHEETSDKRILVPADRKIQILASLGFADMLPKNTGDGFDEIIKQLTPWDGQDRQAMVFNHGKELTLQEVIRKFPNVVAATVVIDPKTERNIGAGNIEPTAFVDIKLKSGVTPTKQLVNAAASIVAGSQAGLQMRNIKVVVNGAPQHVQDDDPAGINGGDLGDLYERRQKVEETMSRRVVAHFPEITGLMCAITVNITTETSNQRKHTTDKVVSEPLRTTSSSKEATGPGGAGGEAGATPNVGSNGSAVLPAPGSAPASAEHSETQNDEKTEFGHYQSWSELESHIPPGMVTTATASIRVPRSHFVLELKQLHKESAAEQDDKSIKAQMAEELPQIRDSVLKCIGLKDPSAISVDPYVDTAPIAQAAPPPAAASAVSLAVGGHLKEIVLGALALVSLFMVSTIVKKGTPVAPVAPKAAAAIAAAGEARGVAALPVLASGELLAGEVGEGGALLDGVELDEDAVRSRQVLEQVGSMVDQDPDAAAALVKRWLAHS